MAEAIPVDMCFWRVNGVKLIRPVAYINGVNNILEDYRDEVHLEWVKLWLKNTKISPSLRKG